MREPSRESGLTLKKSPAWKSGVVEMNENLAMNTLLACSSPAGD